LRSTYGFVGSEIDLLDRGLIYASHLDGRKARLLLTLLLRSGATRGEISDTFNTWLEG
jgi:L-asparaginase